MERRFGAHDRIASDTLLPFSVFEDKHYRERDLRQVAASIFPAQCRAPAMSAIKFQIYLATQADRDAGAASITAHLPSGIDFSFTSPGFA